MKPHIVRYGRGWYCGTKAPNGGVFEKHCAFGLTVAVALQQWWARDWYFGDAA